jgi:hypothetical protein
MVAEYCCWDRVLVLCCIMMFVLCSAVCVLLLVIAGYCCWDRVLLLRSAVGGCWLPMLGLCSAVAFCSAVCWLLLLGSRSAVAFCSAVLCSAVVGGCWMLVTLLFLRRMAAAANR